jgi:hypothetical protein
MVASCESKGDNSLFRSSGCGGVGSSGGNCPISGRKNKFGTPMKFFAEQELDSNPRRIKDELFDLNNRDRGGLGSGNTDGTPPGDGRTTKNRGFEQSSHDGHYNGNDFINVSPPAAKNDSAQWCTDSGGKLVGVGPNCEIDQKGKGALHQCIFDKLKDCEYFRHQCLSNFKTTHMTFSFANQQKADSTVPPVRRPDGCDERYARCKEESASECVCSECSFDLGDGFGSNPDIPVKPPAPGSPDDKPTVYDVNDGPGLTNIQNTNSAYDIAIPLIYGTYTVAGNIIWASQPTLTVLTKREEIQEATRIHVTVTNRKVYYGAFAVAVGEGELGALSRIWFGDMLVYNAALDTDTSGVVIPDSGVVSDQVNNDVLLAAASPDAERYDKSAFRVTFYPGNEEQRPAAVMGSDSPGYRGLSYVLFENINLSYLGGKIPQVRIEVVQRETPRTMPHIYAPTLVNADIGAPRLTALYGDPQSNSVYRGYDNAGRLDIDSNPIATGDAIERLSYDTLEHQCFSLAGVTPRLFTDDSTDLDANSLFVLPSGRWGCQVGANEQRAVITFNPAAGMRRQISGVYDSFPDFRHAATAVGYSPRTMLSFRGFYYEQQPNGNFRVRSADFTSFATPSGGFKNTFFPENTVGEMVQQTPFRALEDLFQECVVACETDCFDTFCPGGICPPDTTPLFACYDACQISCDVPYDRHRVFWLLTSESLYNSTDNPDAVRVYKRTYANAYSIKDLTQDHLRVWQYALTDTGAFGGVVNFVAPVPFDIPASEWGGSSSGLTGLYCIPDEARNTHIVVLRDVSGRAHLLALDPANSFAKKWHALVPNFPQWTSPGPRMMPGATSTWMFINTLGDVVTVDLTTGEFSTVDSVTAAGLPNVGGPQFYDPERRAVTYLTAEATPRVLRVYPSKVSRSKVSVGAILADISTRAGISPVHIDVSDVESLEVSGLALVDDTSARAVGGATLALFGLSTWEQNGQLVFAKRGAGSSHSITVSDMVQNDGGGSYTFTQRDALNDPKKLTLTYADPVNIGRAAYQTVSADTFGAANVAHIKVETGYALTDATAIAVAERLFVREYTVFNEIEFTVSSAYLKWRPNDYVTVVDGASARKYQITEIVSQPQSGQHHVVAVLAYDYLTGEAATIAAYTDPNRFVAQDSYDQLGLYTIHAFFAPPYRLIDRQATKTHHVMYIGVENTSTRAYRPAVTRVRAVNGYEDVHTRGPTIRKPLNVGYTTGGILPFDDTQFPTPSSLPFSYNVNDAVNVNFASPDITSVLQSATLDELLADETRNLLYYEDEWIQFTDFDIVNPIRIRFHGMLRGRFGTDRMMDHSAGAVRVLYIEPGTLEPYYFLSPRLEDDALVSIRLSAPQTPQVQSPPRIFPSTPDSVRPWAPWEIRRYQGVAPTPTNIVLTWDWRGKYSGELNANGADDRDFEPNQVTYDTLRDDGRDPLVVPRYIVYVTTWDFAGSELTPIPLRQLLWRFEKGVEPFLPTGMLRLEVFGDGEVTLTSANQTTIGYDPNVHTLYAYILQYGGPENNEPGFIGRRGYPPGETYVTAPPSPKLRMHHMLVNTVLAPPQAKAQNLGWIAVLKP